MRLFLLFVLKQVTKRSPIPESPRRVSCFAPIAFAMVMTSAYACVTTTAWRFTLLTRPLDIPERMATMFFRKPPSSTPMTSVLISVVKFLLFIYFDTCFADSIFFEAKATAVGISMRSSPAIEGPERATILSWNVLGRSSSRS